MTPYALGLEKNPANYVPLSPLSFLRRAADVYPERLAVIHGDQRHTWRQIYARCRRLASALQRRGIGAGDTVAVIAPNIPAMFEAHYGIPIPANRGQVSAEINTRLSSWRKWLIILSEFAKPSHAKPLLLPTLQHSKGQTVSTRVNFHSLRIPFGDMSKWRCKCPSAAWHTVPEPRSPFPFRIRSGKMVPDIPRKCFERERICDQTADKTGRPRLHVARAICCLPPGWALTRCHRLSARG